MAAFPAKIVFYETNLRATTWAQDILTQTFKLTDSIVKK